jgi:hypothetical protein
MPMKIAGSEKGERRGTEFDFPAKAEKISNVLKNTVKNMKKQQENYLSFRY